MMTLERLESLERVVVGDVASFPEVGLAHLFCLEQLEIIRLAKLGLAHETKPEHQR